MTQTVRVNLEKTALSLKIISTVAGALIACAVVYGGLDSRMDSLEKSDAVKDEKMLNMEKKLDTIYEFVVEKANK